MFEKLPSKVLKNRIIMYLRVNSCIYICQIIKNLNETYLREQGSQVRYGAHLRIQTLKNDVLRSHSRVGNDKMYNYIYHPNMLRGIKKLPLGRHVTPLLLTGDS